MVDHLRVFHKPDQQLNRFWLNTLLAEVNMDKKCGFETHQDVHFRHFNRVKDYLYNHQNRHACQLTEKMMLTQIRLAQDFRGYKLIKKSSLPLQNNTFRHDLPLDITYIIKNYAFFQLREDYLL